MRSRLPTLLASLVLAAGCDQRLDPREGGGVALANNLARAGALEVYVGDDALTGPVERIVDRLAGAELRASVMRTAGPAGPADARAARVVIGPFEDEAVRALLARVGVTVAQGELELLGRKYRTEDVLLAACFEDPRRAKLPVTLLASGDGRRIVDALPRLRVGFRPSLSLDVRGARALDVRLALDGTPLAATLEERTRRALERPEEYAGFRERTDGWSVRAAKEWGSGRVEDYLASVHATRARLAEWVELPPLRDHVLIVESHVDGYAGAEAVDRWASFDRASGLLSALLVPGAPDDAGAAAAAGWATEALGPPALAWLPDAAGVEASDRYWGVPLEEWCGRLARAVRPDFTALVDDGEDGDSPHALRPLRALLVRVAREEDTSALFAAWSGEGSLASLEQSFTTRLADLVASHGEVQPAPPLGSALRGAVVTQPAPGAGAPFGSRACERSLELLDAYGANCAGFAVSYVSEPGPGDGRPLGPRTHAASVEGDVALAAALAQAGTHDWTTLLLPTLLSAPSAGPAGEVVRLTAEHWDELFSANTRCARHFALLAELCAVDVLSLGEGMPEVVRTVWTLDQEENEVQALARAKKTAGWDAALAAARGSFDGALTFAAAAPQKAEWIGFRDRLDVLGMRFLRDLSRGDSPGAPTDDAARRRLAHDLRQCAVAAGDAPWIVLPAGFRSTARAWRGPNEGNGGATDVAEQARLLRALGEALREVGDDAPDGVLLWRWSSDPDAGGSADRDFVLQNKPALDELPGLFGFE